MKSPNEIWEHFSITLLSEYVRHISNRLWKTKKINNW